jgi:hypothetical protein
MEGRKRRTQPGTAMFEATVLQSSSLSDDNNKKTVCHQQHGVWLKVATDAVA